MMLRHKVWIRRDSLMSWGYRGKWKLIVLREVHHSQTGHDRTNEKSVMLSSCFHLYYDRASHNKKAIGTYSLDVLWPNWHRFHIMTMKAWCAPIYALHETLKASKNDDIKCNTGFIANPDIEGQDMMVVRDKMNYIWLMYVHVNIQQLF